MALSGVSLRVTQPYRARRLSYPQKVFKERKTHITKPVSEGDNLAVDLVGVVEEQSVAGVVPKPEYEVAKVAVHVIPEQSSVDVVVQSAVQNEVRNSLACGHQSSFVLGVRDGPNSDIRVLSGNRTHPAVLGSLIQLIPIRHARFSELLSGSSELIKGGV